MNKYKEVCASCGSDKVARCKWVDVNTDEIYDADSGTSLEWCFGKCQEETDIISSDDFTVWQPKLNDEGCVIGHEDDSIFSFEVYSSKEKLLKDFPRAIPLEYNYYDIEEFTIIS